MTCTSNALEQGGWVRGNRACEINYMLCWYDLGLHPPRSHVEQRDHPWHSRGKTRRSHSNHPFTWLLRTVPVVTGWNSKATFERVGRHGRMRAYHVQVTRRGATEEHHPTCRHDGAPAISTHACSLSAPALREPDSAVQGTNGRTHQEKMEFGFEKFLKQQVCKLLFCS